MIIELFSRSILPGSYLIRLKEWGEWSHCAYLDSETNMVIEAVWPEGVRVISYDEWLTTGHKTATARVERPNKPISVWKRAASQAGKGYDSTGVLGLAFHRDWTEDDKWWCSELLEWADSMEGCSTYRSDVTKRIGVRDRWILT